MRYQDLIETMGSFSPEEAREIGSCAIIAMAVATGKTWEQVWEYAKPRFGRYGLNPGQTAGIMADMGWSNQGYFKIIMPPGMNVRQAEQYLQENDPDKILICSIMCDRVPHAICYRDGKFHNVLGAYRAKIRLAYEYFSA